MSHPVIGLFLIFNFKESPADEVHIYQPNQPDSFELKMQKKSFTSMN